MSEVETAGLPETEPARHSLDDIISKNIEAAEARETGQERAPDGKFAAKTTEASPAVEQPVEPPIEPPARWSDADKAEFATLDRKAQKVLSDRYKAMEADYTRKAQEVAEQRKQAAPYLEALSPYEAYLSQVSQQIGTQPHQLVGSLIAAERTLRTGTPQDKASAIARIAMDYGIDLRAFAQGQGIQPIDPAVQQLSQSNNAVGQKLAQLEAFVQQQQTREIESTIDAFKSAKDESGQLKHPYFEDLKESIAMLLQTGKADGLDHAYEIASGPIRKALEGIPAAARAPVQDPAAVLKAQKAAPVKSPGTLPKGTTTPKGLDALLAQSLASAGYD